MILTFIEGFPKRSRRRRAWLTPPCHPIPRRKLEMFNGWGGPCFCQDMGGWYSSKHDLLRNDMNRHADYGHLVSHGTRDTYLCKTKKQAGPSILGLIRLHFVSDGRKEGLARQAGQQVAKG